MKRQTAVAAAAALLGAAALSACTNVTINNPAPAGPSASAESGDGHMMDGEMMHGSMMDADAMFLQMMIPHHEQAVEMSALAKPNGASADVQALADTIAAAQGPEIEQMKGWLDDAGRPMAMDHDMPMDGMISDDEMAQLKAAKGADFDRLYLTFMIAHHEGAVTMAKGILENGDDPNVRDLANTIITAQEAEIAQMKQMLG